MTPDQILQQLRNVPDRCDFAPYETALRSAALQREAITPELIAAIERVSADPDTYLADSQDSLHFFAIYLLAQFREHGALNAFLRFFSLPEEKALDLTGDMVTEHGGAVIASVCGGNPAPLLQLANDESVNEFVRSQAIDALLVQHVWGERSRDAVIADLRGFFSTLQKPGNSFVWAALAGAIFELNFTELLPEVRQAYAEGLVDDSVIGLEDIDPEIKPKRRSYPTPTPEQRREWFRERHIPIDAIEKCANWLCFRDDEDAGPLYDASGGDDDALFGSQAKPYIAPPKVGRNEPCPCGSGKKYKKCCGK